MKIKVEVEVPDGKYCNKACQTGCQFLDGIGRIGRCYCKLFKTHLDNLKGDYTVCGANIKCDECLKLSQEED